MGFFDFLRRSTRATDATAQIEHEQAEQLVPPVRAVAQKPIAVQTAQTPPEQQPAQSLPEAIAGRVAQNLDYDRIGQKVAVAFIRTMAEPTDELKQAVLRTRELLKQLLGQLPEQTEQLLSTLERIGGKHKEFLNVLLALNETENLIYEEIASQMQCSPSRVRGYKSDLERMGVIFVHSRVGRRTAIRLDRSVLDKLLGPNTARISWRP